VEWRLHGGLFFFLALAYFGNSDQKSGTKDIFSGKTVRAEAKLGLIFQWIVKNTHCNFLSIGGW